MHKQSCSMISFLLLYLTSCQVLSASTLPTGDFQYWNNVTAMGPLTTNTRYWLEGQIRLGDDISRLSQAIVRPGIGYKLNDNATVWLGYAYIKTKYPFTAISNDENRIWQQFLWIKDYTWGRLFSRSRLEQRFINNNSPTGWRFRQFGRIQKSFNHNDKFFLAGAEELFIQINNNAKTGSNSGFDQNRIFLGIGCLPNKNLLMEIGYQNQYIRRINAKNYSGNYLATNFILNF